MNTYIHMYINRRRDKPLASSVQFSSVTQSCRTLCDPMNRSTPGLPVHHQPSHPLSSPSPPAPNPSPMRW